MKQKFVVTIAGITFKVLTDEDENDTMDAARTVNSKINNIVLQTANCTKMKAAALCALDYCSQAKRLTRENEALAERVKQLEREVTKSKRASTKE